MKTYTVTKREGEYLGPVDWDYDFAQHGDCLNTRPKEPIIEKWVERIRILSEHPDEYKATTYGGWPRACWGDVLQVGMYDGWPYWKPVPSVLIQGWHSAEWASFSHVTNIIHKETKVVS